MKFSVTKLTPALVGPSEPTPTGNLPLSSIDLTPALRYVMVDSIHVSGHGIEPAKVIREALSKALVPYYPVAGRLLKGDDGDMVVACTGEGAWFVEATADFSLKEVNNLDRPLVIPKEEFLPVLSFDGSSEGVIFMMQVLPRSSPFGAETYAIPKFDPAKPPQSPPPTLTAFDFEYAIADIPLDSINKMKDQCMKEIGQRCSTFDIVTAMAWRARTRAINAGSSVIPDRKGYYGNAVYPVTVSATSETIVRSSHALFYC